MKRKDLDTIIRKIQNRCYLENPTRITYFFDDDENVVFKIFFDSLCIPEKLRLYTDNVQNMFSVTNGYEYEDDFKILELNQDMGYIKVLPDCQKFDIVGSYKEAADKKDDKKEENVLLADKKLNESFAKANKFILFEDELIDTESSNTATEEIEAEQLVPKEAFVISVACALAKDSVEIFKQAIAKVKDYPGVENEKKAVFLTIPKINGHLYNCAIQESLRLFTEAVQEVAGDTYSYLAVEGNTKCQEFLEKTDIQKIHYLTESAQQAIKDNNVIKLADKGKIVEEEAIPDAKTLETFKSIIEIVTPHVNSAKKRIESLRKAKDVSKDRIKFYEKHKDEQAVKNAVAVYKDLFGEGSYNQAKDIAKKREAVAKSACTGIKNPSMDGLPSNQKLQASLHIASIEFKQAAASLAISQFADRKSVDYTATNGSGMFAGVKSTGGVTAASKTGDKKASTEKYKEIAQNTYLDLLVDFVAKDEMPMGFSKACKKVMELLNSSAGFGEEEAKEDEKLEDPEDKEQKDANENDPKETEDKGQSTDSKPSTSETNESPEEGGSESADKLESVSKRVYKSNVQLVEKTVNEAAEREKIRLYNIFKDCD